MPYRRPDPNRVLQGTPLTNLVGAIVRRLALASGEDELQCARDLAAAVNRYIDNHLMLDVIPGSTWREIGDRLGVSPQAAHKKYRHLK
jgi:hypothetical protein